MNTFFLIGELPFKMSFLQALLSSNELIKQRAKAILFNRGISYFVKILGITKGIKNKGVKNILVFLGKPVDFKI